MSNQDYLRLATAFKDAQRMLASGLDPQQAFVTWRLCVHLIANALQAESWRFDRQAFYHACGLQDQLLPTRE